MDCGRGFGRKGGDEVGDAGEGGAGFEEGVLGADFGGPFVVGEGYLGPVEEVVHALFC